MTLEELKLVREIAWRSQEVGALGESDSPSANRRYREHRQKVEALMELVIDAACPLHDWKPYGQSLKRCARCEAIRLRPKEPAHG